MLYERRCVLLYINAKGPIIRIDRVVAASEQNWEWLVFERSRTTTYVGKREREGKYT